MAASVCDFCEAASSIDSCVLNFLMFCFILYFSTHVSRKAMKKTPTSPSTTPKISSRLSDCEAKTAESRD